MANYTNQFFASIKDGAIKSAEKIVPIVMDLLHPQSVIDIGCGTGTWLHVFSNHGVNSIVGVDGAYVDPKSLMIPESAFLVHDLSKPFHLGKEFDLVVSLEVAEHLSENSASLFIHSLTRHGHFVLFSAAIPFQGGTHHVNEQWPEYWARLFDQRGYVVIDCIRSKVWNADDVEFWYAQNTFLYAKRESLEHYPELQRAFEHTHTEHLSLVHPRNYLYVAKRYYSTIGRLQRLIPSPLTRQLVRFVNFFKRSGNAP